MNLEQKLEAVSWGGFDVENIEVITAQLRELVRALHAEDYQCAQATADAIQARSYSLAAQVARKATQERSAA